MAKTKIISVTPIIDTNAYAANDCIGGLLTLNNIVRTDGTGMLFWVRLVDRLAIQAALDLILFSALPSGTFTDQQAISLAAGDAALIIDEIPIVASDYRVVQGNVYIARPSLSNTIPLEATSATAARGPLYAALKVIATPTYSTTSALTLKLGVSQD